MFESTEIRINAPEVEHETIIRNTELLIGSLDDCESVGDELIMCQNHQNYWADTIPLSQMYPSYPIKISLFDADSKETFVLNLLGGKAVCDKEPVMPYGAFLVFNLLCDTQLHGDILKEAPHDKQFSVSLAIYQDFLDSTFNTDDKSEYDCITEYIRKVDVINIIDQHIK